MTENLSCDQKAIIRCPSAEEDQLVSDITGLRGLGGEYARTTPQLDLLRHKVEGQAEEPRTNGLPMVC